MNVPGALIALLLCSLTPAWAAAPGFQAELDPVAFTRATRDDVAGVGNVAGNLDGNTLVITGNFSDLSSPAKSAHLRIGLAMGVPGPAVAELAVTHEVSGVISGKVTLTDEQLARLRRSAVYVQLESVKAPEGNLWGWLEAAH